MMKVHDRALWYASMGFTLLLLLVSLGLTVNSLRQLQTEATRDLPSTLPPELPTSPKAHQPVSPPNTAIMGLFGLPESVAPTDIEPETLPVSTLELVLKGTFVHDDPLRSSALIELPDEPSMRFYPGDQLSNGATVESIRSDAVILNLDGTLQSLYFPHQQEQP